MVSESGQVQWEKFIEAFLFSRRALGVSEGTYELYRSRLKVFFDFHVQASLSCDSPLDCTPSCIQSFFVYLQNNGRRLTTVFGYFRELRTFFRWLQEIGFRQDNPMARIKPPKPEEPLPRTVTEEHFLATIKQLNPKDPIQLRWLTLFTLLFDTGARLGEALNLQVKDVDLQNRLIKVRGKGRKERIVPFGTKTASLLARHLAVLTAQKGRLDDDDLVFQTSTGQRLCKRNVFRTWVRLQKKAGLKPLPIHGLRHGFARIWLLSGGDAFSLQLILGHSDPTVTQKYVTLWASDLQRKHALHSPIDRILKKS